MWLRGWFLILIPGAFFAAEERKAPVADAVPACVGQRTRPLPTPEFFTFSEKHKRDSLQNSWSKKEPHMPTQEELLGYYHSKLTKKQRAAIFPPRE